MEKDNFAILMAGGIGSRFWPVSTAKKPKQFRDLLGKGESLLQTTFKRLSSVVPAENIFILTNSEYELLVREQLKEVKSDQIITEPVMRNTAPAVLLASLKIAKRNKDAVMVMAPSDHWIEDETAFQKDIEMAFDVCRKEEKIMTLGVKPTFPNTGFGYLRYDISENSAVKKVEKFTEKPDYEVAKQFLKDGNYLWNAGIFIWNVQFILDSFRRNLPEMMEIFSAGDPLFDTSEEKAFIESVFPKAQNISIDYAILEKETSSVYVIPANFDWNDLGTWGSLYAESEKDGAKNAILNARVLSENATGNLISTPSNKVVVVDGLQDYIIIDEAEVLLLVPKKKEQEIKEIRERVRQKFGDNLG